ncbi:hypothetical protein [Gilvibacter sediminis]|uniref:hypothetical protein n=1 Tax=Gilvibacter sediminis TaxID=379071 RepID=UPI002350709F|nr:hypothetical protein [Gilvibacter sediminis]MDC7997038.1 hypothetical protein [Gilvibacter sediminis]
MKYKVIPFTPVLNPKGNKSEQASKQLEEMIVNYAERGWTYQRLESVSSFVHPEAGCFGLGGKPGYNLSLQMLVFYQV